MIIQFSPQIKLYGWADSDPVGSSRRIYETLNKSYYGGVIIRPYRFERDKHIVRFRNQLSSLQEYSFSPYMLDGNLDFAKNYIDQFLIRMSGLRAFL